MKFLSTTITLAILSIGVQADSLFDLDKLSETIGKSLSELNHTYPTFNMSSPKSDVVKKKVAVVYEPGKTTKDLSKMLHDDLVDLQNEGKIQEVVSSDVDISQRNRGFIISVNTGNSRNTSFQLMDQLPKRIEKQGLPFTTRLYINPKNIFFGDKNLLEVVDVYQNCYREEPFLEELEDAGYEVVDENDNPDLKITIGLEACLKENELYAYLNKMSKMRLEQVKDPGFSNKAIQNSGGMIGGGLKSYMANPTTNLGKVGGAVGGSLAVVGAMNWIFSDSEKTFARYRVVFEGKDQNKTEFYYFFKSYTGRHPGLFIDPMTIVPHVSKKLSAFFDTWQKDDANFKNSMTPDMSQPDLLEASMIFLSKTKK